MLRDISKQVDGLIPSSVGSIDGSASSSHLIVTTDVVTNTDAVSDYQSRLNGPWSDRTTWKEDSDGDGNYDNLADGELTPQPYDNVTIANTTRGAPENRAHGPDGPMDHRRSRTPR